jgi:hypothetical protein
MAVPTDDDLQNNVFLTRWPPMDDMHLDPDYNLGTVVDNPPINIDNADYFKMSFYNIFQAIPQFCKNDGTLTENANMAIHICSAFLQFMKDKKLGQEEGAVDQEGQTMKFSTMEKQFILIGLFRIYNHYGLLSESGLDPLSAGECNQLYIPIEVSCHSGKKVYNYVFRTGPEYYSVISKFLKTLCPVHTILHSEFDMKPWDKQLYKIDRFVLYMFENDLPTFPFPKISKFSSGYAFNDGFLYFGKDVLASDEVQSPILRFYSWDNPKEFPEELATRKIVFDDKQFYNTNIESVILKLHSGRQLPLPLDGHPHWLCTFVLDHLDRKEYTIVNAIYFLAIVLLTQTRQFYGEQEYLIHAFDDVQGWKNVKHEEWECFEYVMGCMGWVLGVVCRFPIILWLQGKPGTGKSSILSEFVAHVIRKTEHADPSDSSKHMLPILSRNGNGVVQCADALFFSDLQTMIPKDVVAKICSITDPGPKGSYTTNPKCKDHIEIEKRKKGNGNVSALVASNISAPNAIGKRESETGIYRRMFKISFNYPIPKNSIVDPATVMKDRTVVAQLVALSCCIGYNRSNQYRNNTSMFIPSLMARMNSEYEENAHGDLVDLVSDFCRQSITHSDDNVGLGKFTIKQAFSTYYNLKTDKHLTEKENNDFDTILESELMQMFGQNQVQYFQKIIMCDVCQRLHQWKENAVTSFKSHMEAKEYAINNNITCGGSAMQCNIKTKRYVFTHVKLLYTPETTIS